MFSQIFRPIVRNLKLTRNHSTLQKLQHKKAMGNRENIVWIDLELTGLDPNKDRILEIACIVTDGKLNVVAEGPDIAIRETESVLKSMNEWCLTHHAESGLTERCLNSTVSLQEAELQVLNFVMKYTTAQASPLAGNSVYMDRIFLMKHMGLLNDYLSYRIIDVSTVKELCKRWLPSVYEKAPQKALAHRALSDIKESIRELKYFKENAFVDVR